MHALDLNHACSRAAQCSLANVYIHLLHAWLIGVAHILARFVALLQEAYR